MKRTALSAAAVIALMGAGAAEAATTQQLEQKLDAMAAQIEALRAELKDVRAQNAALASQQQTQAKTQAQQGADLQNVQQNVQTAQLAQARPSPLDNLTLWGYGEANYSRPTRNTDDTKMDLARAVFGIGYRFNDKTRFNSEFEIEHAIASSSDAGEFEVEQFYIEHKLTDKVGLNAGLFLIPAGFINRNHEPTNYYGVHRNFVETLIIPSTWREGGLSLYGDTDFGLNWNVGLTTGLDLAKWNFNPENPLFSSALEMQNNGSAPMQTSHQELGLANAKNLSQYVALNYTGIPGVTLGGSVFTGKSSRANTGRRCPISAPPCTKRTPAGRRASGICPLCMPMARSAIPLRSTCRTRARPTRCRRRSTAGSCRPPTTCGRRAITAWRRSSAMSATTWARSTRAWRRASRRPPAGRRCPTRSTPSAQTST